MTCKSAHVTKALQDYHIQEMIIFYWAKIIIGVDVEL